MSDQKTGSKRQSLRFTVEFPFRYKTEFEDGRGLFENISAGGCAIKEMTIPLALQEKILIILDLDDEGESVEVSGRVIRIAGEKVGIKFLQISEKSRQRIVKFFAQKQRSGNVDG